ncbi:nuclear transport factor 2 family protein [Silvanigrella sp.]|uniref:nuclear transport factor 2 family protein n=1 Tax=Silvanigrella sp. TaxID=2024976 RepID=UPI0037C57067
MKSKVLRSTALIGLAISTTSTTSFANPSQDPKQIVKDVFKYVLEDPNYSEEKISKYFSKDYIQLVDGKRYNYEDFLAHIKKQKSLLKSTKVTLKYILSEKDQISSVHIIDAVKKDGKEVKVQVVAYYVIKNNKLVLVDELTHLISGEEEDKKLGSVK